MKQFLGLLFISITLAACGTSKLQVVRSRYVEKKRVEDYTSKIAKNTSTTIRLHATDGTPAGNGEFISDETWRAVLDDYTKKIKNLQEANLNEYNKVNQSLNILTYSGTGLGVIGGVYGISSPNDNQTVSSITSIIGGGLTTIIANVKLQERKTKRTQCDQSLSDAALVIDQYSILTKPANDAELGNFNSVIGGIFKKIRDDGCGSVISF